MKRFVCLYLLVSCTYLLGAQDFLPPVLPWSGHSLSLIASDQHPWITPAEQYDFIQTPDYASTMTWLERLVAASPEMEMVTIGVSEQGREIKMVIASKDGRFTPEALASSGKPVILAQAGIHSGEIDGKDAGMMLLRDIAFGNKKSLIENCHLLFIPILNVDGHERSGPFNRPNQRGPQEMGWRSNANNLNLNRDYTKLETAGIQSVVRTILQYNPSLYIDIHVTDGADYQYDVTYGYITGGYSPAIGEWLDRQYRPEVDLTLRSQGHIPGPLLFAANNHDFSDGNIDYHFSPRFSHAYGDARHVPTILVENHSLKPHKQRVLGTYVFLEQTMRTVSRHYQSLSAAIRQDRSHRQDSIALTYNLRETPKDTLDFLGIESENRTSQNTGASYVQWNGKPIHQKVAQFVMDIPDKVVGIPKAYWIPVEWQDVIAGLKAHGITGELIHPSTTPPGHHYYINHYKLASQPSEGRVRIAEVSVSRLNVKPVSPNGYFRVPTDQPLGILAALLLEPESPDSYFQWGYVYGFLQQTEYLEGYVMEPIIEYMLSRDADLKQKFEQKKKEDDAFATDPRSIYRWFYAQSPYFDKGWKLYPVALEW